jgi:perosamine synthetase
MEPDYWQMDLNQVEAKITPRTKAIVPVHIYGHPTDMAPLMALAEKHGLMVIEDAAEAHGAEYKGQRAGGLGHAAGFSFYGNKIITTGEGGMVTTSNTALAHLAWNLRDHAFSHERHFWHKFVGFNYRMTNLQAAVGLAQVEQLDGFVTARRRNALEYNRRLHGIPGIRTPAEAPWAKNVYWMYGILVDEAEFGMDPRCAAQVCWPITASRRAPSSSQCTASRSIGSNSRASAIPVAEDLCRRGFYLPSASSLTIEEIEYVTDVIREAAQ